MGWLAKPVPLRPSALPGFPGMLAAIGPGIVWMALAQGSGELIFWPYLMAKYGLAFLFLLIPACLLQYPLNYEIGRYTLLTGESIWQGFIRLNRYFAFGLWILMAVSFLWFGAFASAGGTALADLTHFPAGWEVRSQSLFWGYLTIFIFLCGLVFSPVIYKTIEKFMMAVALITLFGLLWSCATPGVMTALPEFLRGLVSPLRPLPRPWDPKDADILLTAITFAGLGGFWTLFYSNWLREKGVGMAARIGKMTSPVTGKPQVIPEAGFLPTENGSQDFKRWRQFLFLDCGIGIFGNLATTLMTCLLSYALLFPQGILPEGWRIAVEQARFFEASWGAIGRIIFLLVAAAFLADTWMATADSVARTHTDVLYTLFPGLRRFSVRGLYYFFIGLLTLITVVTMRLTHPAPMIITSAILGFVGTVIYSVAVLILNHKFLPKVLPPIAKPAALSFYAMGVSCVTYFGLMAGWLWVRFL